MNEKLLRVRQAVEQLKGRPAKTKDKGEGRV